MKTKIMIIILILIYSLSCFGSYHATKYYFKIQWKYLNPGVADLTLIFIPIVNTIYCLYWIVDIQDITIININKFFGIKERR